MSKAFECDRCTHRFSPRDLKGTGNEYLIINDIYSQNYEDYVEHKRTTNYMSLSGDSIIHLCPACLKEFREFMDRI